MQGFAMVLTWDLHRHCHVMQNPALAATGRNSSKIVVEKPVACDGFQGARCR